MAVPNSKTDDALLKNLVPLNTLSDEQLGNLLSRVVVEKAKKGEYLFREGDTDHQNVYLLSGTIALLSGQKEMDLVSSGTQTARFALAHQLPRKHSAQARTAVTYVKIDSRMLSDMLARSHSASYEVNDIQEPSSGDWMSLLLQSPVFQQIPPANLQRVMMRMEEVAVSKGDVIIQQGDEGDYFYLISKGECSVMRSPEEGHAPVELAKLHVGKGFGEEALISEKPRGSTVTMLSDGVLVRLNKQDFIQLVKQPLSRPISYDMASKSVEDGALWLDVRAPEEYEAGHLNGAINLPFFSLRFQASSLTMDRAYVVYGAEVGQAATAAYLLTERGAEVFVLDIGWAELSDKLGLTDHDDVPTLNNVIDFNRDADDGSTQSRPQTEAQRAEVERLKQSLAEASAQFDEELKQRQTEIKLLKQALAVAKEQLEGSKKESQATAELIHEIETLKRSLEQAEARAAEGDTLKAEHARTQDRLAALQETQEQTRQLGEKFRQQSVDLQAKLQQLQQRNETQEGRLKEEITELRLQLDAAAESQQQAAQAAGELERVRAELAELQESSEAFRKQSADDLARLSAERFELQCNLQQLQEQVEANQAAGQQQTGDLSQALNEAGAALERAQEEHRQREAELQAALDAANSAASQAAEASHSEIDRLSQARDGLQQALEESRAQLARSRNEYEQREAELKAALEAANSNAAQAAETSDGEIAALRQNLDSLQQSLQEQRDMMARSQTEFDQREAELQAALNEANANVDQLAAASDSEIAGLRQNQVSLQQSLEARQAELARQQAEYAQREAELVAALEQANLSAQEEAARAQSEIEALRRQFDELQQQMQAEVSTRQALDQEKAELAERLQHESAHAAELAQEAQSLNERLASLEKELDAIQQAGSDAEAQHHNAMAALRDDLEQSRHAVDELRQARQQLEVSLQQAQAEAQAVQLRLDTLMEEQQQRASEEQSRIDAALTDLNKELETARGEIALQQDKRVEMEALLEQEHQTAAFMQRSLKTAEEAVEITEQRLAEAEQAQQSLESRLAELQQRLEQEANEKSQLVEQLQQELSAGQEAWRQASESDSAVRLAKQELASLKNELEHEISNLRAQLELEQETHETVLKQRIEENERLQQRLNENQASAQGSEATIATLKSERQNLREAKSELEAKLTQVEEASRATAAEFNIALDAGHKQIESLKAELEAAKARMADTEALESARQSLRKMEAENASLKREISGLREVQMEMESQLSDDADTEISRLRAALEAEEVRRQKAEKLAQQNDVLRRERQVQETAIEMLGEDLDALTQEKTSLIQERDKLSRQLNEIRSQYTDLVSENDQLHSEMSGFREQASDSNLADDLLLQMEELRIKADNYERERDEAKAEAKRMRREVGELRSVIETYVEQIQDVQSLGADEQVAALRTELDMVRRQAHEDLERMRMQLSEAESRLTDSDSRDVDVVAAQQAIRQEMVSMQQALNEKDHLLRLSQNQCRSLEDAIEDRDKEVDQLKRKLELLLRKTGGLDDPSMQLGARQVGDSRLRANSGRDPDNTLGGDSDSRKSGLGRLFRKK
jgi:CRP-like cAMP-binding protein/chromosome segregation ATPase